MWSRTGCTYSAVKPICSARVCIFTRDMCWGRDKWVSSICCAAGWLPAEGGELEMKIKQWCKGSIHNIPMIVRGERKVVAAEGEQFTVSAV